MYRAVLPKRQFQVEEQAHHKQRILNSAVKKGVVNVKSGVISWRPFFVVITKYKIYFYQNKDDLKYKMQLYLRKFSWKHLATVSAGRQHAILLEDGRSS
jgi:hypothetical protein